MLQPDRASGAIGLANLVAHAQIVRFHPAFAFDIEGMLRRRLNPLAVNDEFGENFTS